MFAPGIKATIKLVLASLYFLSACAFAQSDAASKIAYAISTVSAYPESLELQSIKPPSTGETRIYRQLLRSPAQKPMLLSQNMVDRSVLINLLREDNALPLIRLWSSPRSHFYFGVSPNGLAGLNFSQKRRLSAKEKNKRVAAKDYSTRIRELTNASDSR
ncbi:MAG: hypothetical protein AAF385_15020 [Pseudomonadota bacterium]